MPFAITADAHPGWDGLTEAQQIQLSRAALCQAVDMVACQAETLAHEMENGVLLDQGGPEALLLLARVLRIAATESDATVPVAMRPVDLSMMAAIGSA